MLIDFVKMHGTGNDFIVLDQFSVDQRLDLSQDQIAALCDRRFGIGADGLIMLRKNSDGQDFDMVYFNADGKQSSMCGNGGRCIVMYAFINRYIGLKSKFAAIDGIHHAEVENDQVILGMNDVTDCKNVGDEFVLNTGSPHLVQFIGGVSELDVKTVGAGIRYSAKYKKDGINVNFVEMVSDHEIFIRTYERGVEDETYSCGTGVTAAAIASKLYSGSESNHWKVSTQGGHLEVKFENDGNAFTNIKLIGPARIVYKGQVMI